MNINLEVAVAAAAVGVNIIAGNEKERQGHYRVITGLATIGGNAVGQAVIDIKVGGKVMDTIRTSATGLGLLNAHIKPSRIMVPANALVEAVVQVAPTVSPILIVIEFVP